MSEIIFNSQTSVIIILILLLMGYKDVKIGLSMIFVIVVFYITYLS